MTPFEANTEILKVLGQEPEKKGHIENSIDFCLEDRDGRPVMLAEFLVKLIGKKVVSVRWVNEYDRNKNPDLTIGHFDVTVE